MQHRLALLGVEPVEQFGGAGWDPEVGRLNSHDCTNLPPQADTFLHSHANQWHTLDVQTQRFFYGYPFAVPGEA
jgi:hypothetical protein